MEKELLHWAISNSANAPSNGEIGEQRNPSNIVSITPLIPCVILFPYFECGTDTSL